jgi:hypothetical protein
VLTVAWCQGAAARLLAGAIVAFYAVLGLGMLAPESVYSGDIGVKYVQARALADQRFRTLDIPYPGELLDPAREFIPLRPPFVMVTGETTQAIFPPASAVIQAVAVSLGGFRGLIALSIVASALVLLASWKLAPARYGLPVLVAIGLGGPLWFYAVSGWEHAPAVAFGTAAFAWALRSPAGSRSVPIVAGALVGAGATLRDEVILLAPGLLLGIWLRERGWRRIGAAIAGLLVPLLLAAAIEVWWFERPAAAHLRHAVHLLQTALHVTNEPNPDVPALRPMTARERYDTVVTYWLFGRGTDPQVASFVTALLVALFVRWKWRSSLGILLWLLAFGATAVGDLWEVLTAPKWLAGLIRVSPYAVFAVLPFANLRSRKLRASYGWQAASRGADEPHGEENWLAVVAGFTTLTYLAIAYAGVDTSGGKSLGPRLLLPLLPLLSVSSIVIISSYLRSAARADRAVGVAGMALVAVAVLIHLGGTIPAYRNRNADDASAVLAAGASHERILVADDMYTAQLLFPLYDRKIILLADTIESGERLGARLAQHRLGGALLISRNPEPSIGLPPLRVERTDMLGRMVVQVWRR